MITLKFFMKNILMKMVNHIHKKTNMKNLCLGGGVALNGVANHRILKDGPFEKLHIPPSPGDAGSAIGCGQYSCPNPCCPKRALW